MPDYDPLSWGAADDVQYNNNCYNYACDIKGAYAQPGRFLGVTFGDFKCEEVGQAAMADGLVPIDCNERCSKNCHKVALTLSPGKGFHWYRRDRNGYWSHKQGDMPPTNLDASGNPIVDPRTANRGYYTVFCGCYCVCPDRVSIR